MKELKEISFLKPNQILTGPNDLLEYGRDWTRYYTPNPRAILLPKTTKEVQEIILWARKNKISLVPSGGRTGLSGGAVAKNKEVVLSLKNMNQILELNEADPTLTCEAGTITETVQNFAKDKGFLFPMDFAARGSSQIGGNVSTNVGGLNVIGYGLMRDWVLGLEVVTGAGEILQMGHGLIKNNTGYDLKHLFIGAEGTLGVITKVTLKLTRPKKEASTMILGLKDPNNILEIFKIFRKDIHLLAFEMFTDSALRYVLNSHKDLSTPLETSQPYYLLIETETPLDSQKEQFMDLFEKCLTLNLIEDGVLGQSETQSKNLWKYRDFISESLSPMTPYKNDISIKVSHITEFMREAHILLQKEYPHYEVVWFGHIGDGNLHINILKPKDLEMDQFVKDCQHVDVILFELVQKLNGSISAEHGVGLSKKPFLSYSRSLEEINLMKQIKKVFDPDLILNPGKIFDI